MDGESVTYSIDFSSQAEECIKKYKKSNPIAYKKLQNLILELVSHPKVGTGHPEPLKGGDNITWSRHITKKDRLIYDIYEDKILVLVISIEGHYEDK